jgi:hypothetical protein
VPERLVYALYNWRDLLPVWDQLHSRGADLQRAGQVVWGMTLLAVVIILLTIDINW